VSEIKRIRRTVLSPEQWAEYDKLRAQGYTYSQARYQVLTKEQRKDFKKQVRAAERHRYKRNPYEEIIKAARNSANRRGVDFEITEDDLEWPEYCPVFPWIKLHYPGHYHHDPAGASLDRKNNGLGYVEDNVIVVSLRANLLRKDASSKELYCLAEFYLPYLSDLDEEFDAGYVDPYADC
jgi:hypothetical protein